MIQLSLILVRKEKFNIITRRKVFQVTPVSSESKAILMLLTVSKKQNVCVFFNLLSGQITCVDLAWLTDFQRIHDSFLVNVQPDREVFAVFVKL